MKKDEVFFYSILVFIAGISYGSFFEPHGVAALLLGSAFLFALGTIFRSAKCFSIGLFILLWLSGSQSASVERIFYKELPEYDSEVSGVVRIITDPEERDTYRKTVIRFERCDSSACPKTRVLWQAPLSFQGKAGTTLRFQCLLQLPEDFTPDFDYRMFLAKDSIGYVCLRTRKAEVLPEDREGIFRAALYVPKHSLEKALSRILNEPEAGLAKGLLLGGDNYLPAALKESFTRVGLSHMIAVSGYNITLIAEMLLILGIALGLWRKQAIWMALFGIVFFILMIGLPASAARAGAMAGIVFVALQSGRLAQPVRTLLFAGAVMLFHNPLLLRYDLGFQLSFLATLGILIAMPYYERFAPVQLILKKGGEILFMTLVVELFVLPLILFSFHTFSPLIVIGNFLVILVPFAMATSFVSALLFLIFPGAHVIVAWGAFGILTLLTRSVEWLGTFTKLSITLPHFGIWHLVFWYVILTVLMIVFSRLFFAKSHE